MTLYGNDNKADMNIATDLARVQALMPFELTYGTQWTYVDGSFVQHYGSAQFSSSLLVKFEKPA